MPGSQPPFSFNPDPEQNTEDASIISVGAYVFDIPFLHPAQLCPLPHQNFEKNAKDPARIPEPWIQDPRGFRPFSWVQIIPSKKKSVT